MVKSKTMPKPNPLLSGKVIFMNSTTEQQNKNKFKLFSAQPR